MEFLEYRLTNNEDRNFGALIRQDYEQIGLNLGAYSRRLEVMVSVATSLVQTIDSRRSLSETMNISRLTYLALSFIPLTFVSGLFSMKENVAPGGKLFWLYFSISIPLCMLVFLIAHIPITTPGVLSALICKPRASHNYSVRLQMVIQGIDDHVRGRLFASGVIK